MPGLEPAWQISGTGDLDGDGKADLIWRNSRSGDVAEWLMNGAAVKSWCAFYSALPLDWQISGIGDLDGDGKADLILRNTASGDVMQFAMEGAILKAWSTIYPGSDWANKAFSPLVVDHLELTQFLVMAFP